MKTNLRNILNRETEAPMTQNNRFITSINSVEGELEQKPRKSRKIITVI